MAYTGTVRSVLGVFWLVILLLGTSVTATTELEISFHNGRVTIIADDIPVQRILQAWSEIGQTMFVDTGELRSESTRVDIINVDEMKRFVYFFAKLLVMSQPRGRLYREDNHASTAYS